MPACIQPINIYLIPALEIPCRCYSRSISSSSPLLSSHPLCIHSLSHSFTLLPFHCFTLLQCWPLTAARIQSVQWCNVHPSCDATWVNAPLRALTFCQHFSSLFKALEKKFCSGLHQATYREVWKLLFLWQRGGKAIVPAETMEAAGRHAAVRTWMAGLWDVCGSVARGLRPKAPFPAPHKEPAQGRGS